MTRQTGKARSKELKGHDQPRSANELAERLAIASKLHDVQEELEPIREANRAKRKAGRVKIRIKTA
jgi:hypothetical protein